MRKIFVFLFFIISFSAIGQEKLNGEWIEDPTFASLTKEGDHLILCIYQENNFHHQEIINPRFMQINGSLIFVQENKETKEKKIIHLGVTGNYTPKLPIEIKITVACE